MTTDIIKVVATLAISIVFDSCHNVRETVEEAAVHADVSYDVCTRFLVHPLLQWCKDSNFFWIHKIIRRLFANPRWCRHQW
jgi:hypothetical protein